jgi:hypothetical protein
MTEPSGRVVRIGCASGFWGDSEVGAPQLVQSGQIDYLVFDYLAETTMAILAAARTKRPELGFATDFVDVAMRSVVADVARRRIKVVANAGGLNPRGCAAAVEKVAAEAGVALKVAVVEGDDVSALLPSLRAAGQRDVSGAPLPERILSANAYLGAFPIAAALAAGADVVVTGRCVDSAVVLGPLVHELGWSAGDLDLLAAGSLAGHVVECGCQATGGLHTDWERVAPSWADIGYPIVECRADGSFTVTKPRGTGGLVVPGTVAEQLLYEIGDPGAYVLPDVVCDFRRVTIEQEGPDRVRVTGARGRPPPDAYKVSATWVDGFRATGMLVVVGIDAVAKARRTGEAILERTRAIFRRRGLPDYARTNVEVVGGETLYGPHARAQGAREVMMRVTVDHPRREALEIFSREIAPAATSWAPGTAGSGGGGRPSPSPLVRQLAFMLPKERVEVRVVAGGEERRVAIPPAAGRGATPQEPPEPAPGPAAAAPPAEGVAVPLAALALARSGDKGDTSNIGVVARRPEWLPLLLGQLTPAAVKAWLAHLVKGEVRRYVLPGIHALNFVLEEALDGGGPASQRVDPLGKGMAQILLDMPVAVSRELAAALGRGGP